jgi:hypothetical protein
LLRGNASMFVELWNEEMPLNDALFVSWWSWFVKQDLGLLSGQIHKFYCCLGLRQWVCNLREQFWQIRWQ